MKDLLLFPHLGLGDLIVCNGLVRQLASKNKVFVLCRPQNVASARFQWRDNLNIELLELTGSFDEQEARAKEFFEFARKQDKPALGLGVWGTKPFEIDRWDHEMFRQAGLAFKDHRWNHFRVDRQPSREFELPAGKRYVFLHDDPKRGFKIDGTKLPRARKIVRPEPLPDKQGGAPCIFDWWATIEQADEIHVIDSAFLCLIDSLPHLRAKRIVFHRYARPGGRPPSTIKDWEVIDDD